MTGSAPGPVIWMPIRVRAPDCPVYRVGVRHCWLGRCGGVNDLATVRCRLSRNFCSHWLNGISQSRGAPVTVVPQ